MHTKTKGKPPSVADIPFVFHGAALATPWTNFVQKEAKVKGRQVKHMGKPKKGGIGTGKLPPLVALQQRCLRNIFPLGTFLQTFWGWG